MTHPRTPKTDRSTNGAPGWPSLALLLLGATMALLAACGKKEEPAPREVVRPVKVMTVAGAAEAFSQTYPGTTRAAKRVDLSFRVAGPLVELPAEEGKEVQKGELIARILPRDFKIQLDEAKARAKEAEQQFKRYKELYVRKQVSKAEFDRFKASRDVAQAQLDDAQNALKDTYLNAPFAGLIATRYVENFEDVQAKQPIVSLQDVTRIEVLVDVPEVIMAQIRQEAEPTAIAEFDAAPGEQFPLEVKEYAAQADPQTQTYQVVLVMPQPKGVNILPGMTARVTGTGSLETGQDSVVVIPAIAVMEGGDGKAYVWVLDKEAMTVHQKQVKVGELTGSQDIRIESGLEGGETLVVAGLAKLEEGMTVSIWEDGHEEK